jgi:hypothetical protein
MLNIWSVKSGHSLGSLQEGRVPLPLVAGADLSNITFNVISGTLPQGLT